jgi:high-affinity Fe2+/Pb2+ permease
MVRQFLTEPKVFFICLRESLETSIIVSVLLAFLKQTLGPDQDKTTYTKLVKQVSSTETVHHPADCSPDVHRYGWAL